MKSGFCIVIFALFSLNSAAQEDASEFGFERDPASIPTRAKRSYPGGADEEDLTVQPQLPEATLKADARGIQKDVYKGLFNRELRDERQDAVEE
jgi:hypothetical protein